jgi:hypothetical protein
MSDVLEKVKQARELLKSTKGDMVSLNLTLREIQYIHTALRVAYAYDDILDDELGLNDRRIKVKC